MLRYRVEVDGLRALAIAPVILYHAGVGLFPGGFVGVDVFFVISGYLITGILIEERRAGTFSLRRFYERRARRILPALFVVVLAVLPFAWMWLSPRDLKDFAKSLIAVSTFSSNFLFWRQSGYFDVSSELKPLLHTWSLAVEEQYYIVFPLLLAGVWRWSFRVILAVLLGVCALSLGFADVLWRYDATAAFYLLPSRFWEILVGSIAAFVLAERAGRMWPCRWAEALSLLGLGLIAYAVLAFDHATPTPGLATCVPVLGAALVVLFAQEGNLTHWLLGRKLVVGVGLISYSAYLWHHPLLAFARYRAEAPLDTLTTAALLAATLLLAAASWKFVETPIRRAARLTRRRVCVGAFASIAVGLGVGMVLKSPWVVENDAWSLPARPVADRADILLVGDSHAGHLFPGLRAKLGDRVVNRSAGGCIPFFGVDRYDSRSRPGECVRLMNAALEEFARDPKWRTLVLSTMGPVYIDGTPFRGKDPARVRGLGVVLTHDPSVLSRAVVFERGMRETLARLSTLPGKRVVFVIDVPELGLEERECGTVGRALTVFGFRLLETPPQPRLCAVPRAEVAVRTADYRVLVARVLAEFPQVRAFDPTQLFCDDAVCHGVHDGHRLYRDMDHLSDYGSVYVAEHLAAMLADPQVAAR